MAITRFHPPFADGTRIHQRMDPSSKGEFVLYKDHIDRNERVYNKLVKAQERIVELEALLAEVMT